MYVGLGFRFRVWGSGLRPPNIRRLWASIDGEGENSLLFPLTAVGSGLGPGPQRRGLGGRLLGQLMATRQPELG